MPKRILVVEDDTDILFIVQFILKDAGFEIFTSADGENLMEVIGNCRPDLILMDVRLPKQDGRLLCESIKAQMKEMPIIVMSAHADYRNTMQQTGADDFISKPFDMEKLVQRINLRVASCTL
ncbi:MAG TPA: response regulator [Pedobacter sp.]|jgi:DNA-binding response OmpR family regulator